MGITAHYLMPIGIADTLHINNIYSIGELDKVSTCSILEQVRNEGGRALGRCFGSYRAGRIIIIVRLISSERQYECQRQSNTCKS